MTKSLCRFVSFARFVVVCVVCVVGLTSHKSQV
jgi:hypothetical protein